MPPATFPVRPSRMGAPIARIQAMLPSPRRYWYSPSADSPVAMARASGYSDPSTRRPSAWKAVHSRYESTSGEWMSGWPRMRSICGLPATMRPDGASADDEAHRHRREQRLEPRLALAQALLGLASDVDVDHRADETQIRAAVGAIETRPGEIERPAIGPIGAAQPELRAERLAGGVGRRRKARFASARSSGWTASSQPETHGLGLGLAGIGVPGAVEVGAGAGRVRDPQHGRGLVGDSAEPRVVAANAVPDRGRGHPVRRPRSRVLARRRAPWRRPRSTASPPQTPRPDRTAGDAPRDASRLFRHRMHHHCDATPPPFARDPMMKRPRRQDRGNQR